MKQRLVSALFVFLLLAALLAGLGKTLLLPKDINYYENRYADKAAPLTAAGLLDGSWQDALEAALADQIPGAQKLKRAYHMGYSAYQRITALPLSEGPLSDRMLNIGSIRMFDGFLSFWYRPLEREKPMLERKAENYVSFLSAHPETEVYLYYVEKDTDFDPETGTKNGCYEYLRSLLPLGDDRAGRFAVDSADDLQRYFFHTDHHWNAEGSYRAYTEILSLLLPGEAPLEPLETVTVGEIAGSKTKQRATAAFRERFEAYRFDFPEYEVLLNGAPERDYGAQDIFLDGLATDDLGYGSFYGGDEGCVYLHCPENAGKGTLLVVGDSFDNALLKLLAAHFETLIDFDPRNFRALTGVELHLEDYLEQYPEAKLLLVGNLDYFVMDEFMLED